MRRIVSSLISAVCFLSVTTLALPVPQGSIHHPMTSLKGMGTSIDNRDDTTDLNTAARDATAKPNDGTALSRRSIAAVNWMPTCIYQDHIQVKTCINQYPPSKDDIPGQEMPKEKEIPKVNKEINWVKWGEGWVKIAGNVLKWAVPFRGGLSSLMFPAWEHHD
ncbi:hypothetical protein BT63DRAFT_476337 [Microthyrium microscopicum]|uniref:Uncharacterized protein n=1 Tax=Microthyrium microscopicum TaxID=703497 RepID=A0A6A6UQ78_9PEZI|nr:hypothetical protein BT63DRAFT_476337 [Microthyrium microscopicum]